MTLGRNPSGGHRIDRDAEEELPAMPAHLTVMPSRREAPNSGRRNEKPR